MARAGERYVLLGLAQPRSSWFRAVAQWANAGTIPAEFLKCVSAEELRARLRSGRPFSAVLVDGATPALDRDLVDTARARGCAVLVVDGPGGRRDRAALGGSAVLPEFFDHRSLLEALAAHATPIGRGDTVPADMGTAPGTSNGDGDGAHTRPARWGRLVLVCGPGGTGASSVAIGLAQGLADDPRLGGSVLLADLALHAEQAMLHDAGDVLPGVQELVELHRAGRPSVEEVRSLAFAVRERRYQLLLGLRQARSWPAIRARALDAAVESLQVAYRVVVCDADADLEGEAEGGSIDVEERHALARTAAARADVVLAVGQPGMKGVHSLVRVVAGLRAFGAPAARIVPVVNRAPARPRARAELAAALDSLTEAATGGPPTAAPVFVPEAHVDDALRDGVRLRATFTAPLTAAYAAVVDILAVDDAGLDPDVAPAKRCEPELVARGSLGVWSE